MLTKEEEQELALLEQEEANQRQMQSLGSMTPDEEAELAALEQEENQFQQEKEAGYLDKGMKTLVQIGKFIDSITGAPIRAGVGELQKGIGLPSPGDEVDKQLEAQGFVISQDENPDQRRTFTQSIGEAAQAGIRQFGRDPELAPTGKQLMEKTGMDKIAEMQFDPNNPVFSVASGILKKEAFKDIKPSDVAGFAMDVVLDPSVVVPTAAIGKIAKKAPAAAAKTVAKAADMATGTDRFSTILNATEDATKGVIKSMRQKFSISRAKDADEFLKIADDLGIDKNLLPEAVEYGPESFLSRQGRVIAEGPLGAQRLENFSNVIAQVNSKMDETIDAFGKKFAGDADAGKFLVDSLEKANKKFFDSMDITYNKVISNSPGMMMTNASQRRINSMLTGIERFAKGRIARGIGSQKQEAQTLLEMVGAVKRGNGSLKQTIEVLKNIGEEAFKPVSASANRIPIDTQRMREAYRGIRKEVLATIRSNYGEKVSKQLELYNQMIEGYLGERGVIGKYLTKDAAPEEILTNLIKNGNTKEIEAISAIAPEAIKGLRGHFLNGLVKRNADGFLLADSTIKNIDKKRDIVAKLFSPNEMEKVSKIIKFQKRLGRPIMSTSGTGASNAFNQLVNEAKSTIIGESTIETLKKQANKPAQLTTGGGFRDLFGTGAKGTRVLSIQDKNKKLISEKENEKKRRPSND